MERLKVRKATKSDLSRMLAIYAYAREQMKKNGNPSQWITHPRRELLVEDIENGNGYVITSGEDICGVFAFIPGEDPTYRVIENGQWVNDDDYGVIHRIASDGTRKGILETAVGFAALKVPNIRIDTHEDNIIMQNALSKLGFEKCGTIYVSDDVSDHSPRVAYQKVCGDEGALGKYMATGMCLGCALGTAIGASLNHVAVGMPIGLALGTCIGLIIGFKKK